MFLYSTTDEGCHIAAESFVFKQNMLAKISIEYSKLKTKGVPNPYPNVWIDPIYNVAS